MHRLPDAQMGYENERNHSMFPEPHVLEVSWRPHLPFRLALYVIHLVLAQTTYKIDLSPNVLFSSTVWGSLELLYQFNVISNVTDSAYDKITAFVAIEIKTKS